MINNILFVCIGNICRSPMAEGLLKQALPDKQICSAGLNALVGEPADPLSVKLLAERGIDIRQHRAKNIAAWMASESDLILTMDDEQKRFIELKYPVSRNKVFRLAEFGRYDVPDPYQLGPAAFRQAYHLISLGVAELARYIADHEAEATHLGNREKQRAVTGQPPWQVLAATVDGSGR